MTRHVLLLDLQDAPDLIATHERWHEPGRVPAGVVASIRAAGIAGMTIYRAGNRLVMIMETEAGFDPAAKAARDAADPDVQAWERLIDGFQQPVPAASSVQKWTPAVRISPMTQQR